MFRKNKILGLLSFCLMIINQNKFKMEISEMLQAWGAATMNGNWETFNSLTSDDFQLIGPGPEPLNKQAYWTWINSVVSANPDHNNNLELTAVSDNVFAGTVQMEGTHTGDWDLSFMGIGIIPATGKKWKNPKENLTVTIIEGKVMRCEVEVPDDGGIAGILTQLGVGSPQ